MQLAFAIPGDPDARTGGTLYDRQVIDALRVQGHDVAMVALPGNWPHPDASDAAEALACLDALPGNCPVVIDGLAFGALSPAIVAKLTRPVIAMVHHPLALEPGLTEAEAQGLFDRERTNLAHAAQIVVPSAHVGGLLTARFGVASDRVHVAHPGFTAAAPAAVSAALDGPPLILSVGLICHRKGHDVLLRALGRVAGLDWRTVIVGRKHDAAHVIELERLCADLDLRTRVTFAGELSAPYLAALYARARVFALATRYEGYGMVLSEAQQYGLPVVSCDTGAVPEALDGSGLLAPPDDPDAFAAHLRGVLTNAELHATLTAKSRARAANLPTWEDTARVMAGAAQNAVSR